MRRLAARLPLLRRFVRAEEGSSTVEFVLWVPFMLLFLASMVESAMFMTRWMLLDRALDIAVRELRLATFSPPTFPEFRQSICDYAKLPECMARLQVELVPVTNGTWTALANSPNCINRSSDIEPVNATTYTPGVSNQIMAVRVCALMDPMYPNVGLGFLLPKDANGELQVIAFSAYAQEP